MCVNTGEESDIILLYVLHVEGNLWMTTGESYVLLKRSHLVNYNITDDQQAR